MQALFLGYTSKHLRNIYSSLVFYYITATIIIITITLTIINKATTIAY